jgi:hypothetical protein
MRFPPVRPLPTLDPWSAPQSLEAGPQSRSIRPAIASGTVIQARDATATREAHRYAQINGSIVFNITPTNQLILPAPQNYRNILMFRNIGANIIYVEFGREAGTQSTILLQPTQILLFDSVVPQDDVNAISPAGSGELSVSFSNINFLEPVT